MAKTPLSHDNSISFKIFFNHTPYKAQLFGIITISYLWMSCMVGSSEEQQSYNYWKGSTYFVTHFALRFWNGCRLTFPESAGIRNGYTQAFCWRQNSVTSVPTVYFPEGSVLNTILTISQLHLSEFVRTLRSHHSVILPTLNLSEVIMEVPKHIVGDEREKSLKTLRMAYLLITPLK